MTRTGGHTPPRAGDTAPARPEQAPDAVPAAASPRTSAGRAAWEALALAAVPTVELACAAFAREAAAALTLLTAVLACMLMAASIDRSRPPLAQLLPTVAMGAVAAAGRVAFAALPFVKPVSAIAIVAGSALGPRAGFATGALAALVSNAAFGQGPWTPLQMYAWGLVGYLGGAAARRGLLEHRVALAASGLASGLLYGLILDSWHVLGFVRPLTWQAAALAYAAGLPFNLMHGLATAAFLELIWNPWRRAIARAVSRHRPNAP